MAISVRYFVFEEGGALKHVPHRIRDGLHADEDALPDYAGTRQRVAEVLLDNEDGKPVRILDVRGQFWGFDKDGHLNRDEWFSFMRGFDPFEERRGKVVDLRPDIERRAWKKRNTWDITGEDLDRVTAAVWPWLSGAQESSVQAVKGKARKEPPLTAEGREALVKIESKIADIAYATEKLSEPALKGLAHALRQQGRLYETATKIYEAFAADVDREREIKARRRTGRGEWFARLEVWSWNEDRSSCETIETIEERCPTRDDAVATARRLLAEHAHRFDLRFTVEAEVISELEWVPMKHRKEPDLANDR